MPVRAMKTHQNKNRKPGSDSIKTEKALASMPVTTEGLTSSALMLDLR
jgi:hypothetical protein